MGKQVLEKCLIPKPQPEYKMWTLTSNYPAGNQRMTCNPGKMLGKMNRPKFQKSFQHESIFVAERVKTLYRSGEGRTPGKLD
ncbi:MAG: hypothetical protein AAFS12_05380 [Cyanobacteria bacterium J06632_19]